MVTRDSVEGTAIHITCGLLVILLAAFAYVFPSPAQARTPILPEHTVTSLADGSEIKVKWKTDVASDSTVLWSLSKSQTGISSSTSAIDRCDGGKFTTLHCVLMKNLTPYTEYLIRPRSCDAAGDCVSAQFQNIVTNGDTSPPSPPTIQLQKPMSDRIDLLISGGSDNVGIVGYNVFRDGTNIGTVERRGEEAEFSDRAVSPGTTYSYTAYSYDAKDLVSTQASEAVQAALPEIKTPIAETKSAPDVSVPLSGSLTKILRVGASGDDVRLLQKLLQREGVYGDGKITNYFGELTKKAVIRFQEKYTRDILKPAGLTRGSGTVGAGTLKKINQLLKEAGAGTTVSSKAEGGDVTTVALIVKPLSSIDTVVEGDRIFFSAQARMSDGTLSPVPSGIEWRVVGDIGTISVNGTFVAELGASVSEYGESAGAVVATYRSAEGLVLTANSTVFTVKAYVADTELVGAVFSAIRNFFGDYK